MSMILGGRGASAAALPVMHDFAQRLPDLFECTEPKSCAPEFVGPHPLDHRRFLPHWIQMHLERRHAVHEIPPSESASSPDLSEDSALHTGDKEVESVGVAVSTDIAPLHERSDFLPQTGDCRRVRTSLSTAGAESARFSFHLLPDGDRLPRVALRHRTAISWIAMSNTETVALLQCRLGESQPLFENDLHQTVSPAFGSAGR